MSGPGIFEIMSAALVSFGWRRQESPSPLGPGVDAHYLPGHPAVSRDVAPCPLCGHGMVRMTRQAAEPKP